MTIDQANAELCWHRDRALTSYANGLIADGASVDDEIFRRKMIGYARSLEFWRTTAMSRLRELVRAQAEIPPPILH
jgi:hypothetical protein